MTRTAITWLRCVTPVFVAGLVLVPIATSLAAGSPSSLLATILAAGRAQRTVHYVSTARLATVRVVQVADVGATDGIQRIKYSKAERTGRVTVIVSAHRAYVRGDAFVLVNYMGFKAAASARYANRWVSIPRGDRDYPAVAADVTLPSEISSLQGQGLPLAAPSTTIRGQRVVGVRWRASVGGKVVVETLYARAVGEPLPVEERASRGSSMVGITFSHWNEPLHVSAPSSAVPIAATGLE